jgi:hypothetical protein
MPVTLLFILSVLCAGFGVVRGLGAATGMRGLGLAPAAGLAALVTLSSWCVLSNASALVAGVAVYALIVSGVALAVRDRAPILAAASTLARDQKLVCAMLAAALAIPLIALGLAFGGAQVPLSPHDGAAHTEAVQAFRQSQAWSDWYPPGTAALFAAWLAPFPWIDSALGAFELGLSLPSLASLAVFGLSLAIWRDLRMAAASALLLSFTYLYPYFPQLWSGWPLALSLILVMGVWTVALEYVDRPAARWGVLAGLGLGAVVLVHGSELFTLAILLPFVLIGAARRVVWSELPRAVGLAILVGIGCAASYLPNLIHWAGAGGAYSAGLADGPPADPGAAVTVSPAPVLFVVFVLDSLGIDFPIRLLILAVGIVWVFRDRVGRSVAVVGLVFAGLATLTTLLNGVPAVRQFYALSFPWAMHYRLLMLSTIAQVLLAGAGGVVALSWVSRWSTRETAWARRLGRLTRLLVVTWVVLMTWALVVYMAYPASLVLGYSDDDAAAMAWLGRHAAPGDVVLNDFSADAGIWAPFKAGPPVLLPRSPTKPVDKLNARLLVHTNVARLDQSREARAAACAEHVKYVYYGARTSQWDTRRFPPVAELQASPALEQVFSQGEAVVFRTRLRCSPTD